jgi:hypothetical protein
VFHPFRQAEATTTRKHPGLGLGLAIVRHLSSCTAARSPLRVPRRPGCDVLRSAADHRRAKSALEDTLPFSLLSGSGPLPKVPDLTGVRVLVIDDEADAREILVTMLQQSGAAVRSAGSATEALELLDNKSFDVLVRISACRVQMDTS